MKEKRTAAATDAGAMQPYDLPEFSRVIESVEYKITYDNQRLPLDQLTYVLANACAKANTLEQIIADHKAWAECAAREPAGSMKTIIQSCIEPGGKSRALALMLARNRPVFPQGNRN